MITRLFALAAILAFATPALADGCVDNVNGVTLDKDGKVVRFNGLTITADGKIGKLPTNSTQQSDMSQMCGETRPIHQGRHPNSYEQAISDKLQGIESRLNAGSITQTEARSLVNELMSKVRTEISTGGHLRINDASLSNFIRNLRL